MKTLESEVVNGIDLSKLRKLAEGVAADPADQTAKFSVTTAWKGGTLSETRVDGWQLGRRKLTKDFKIRIDEPAELCGKNTQPNPQEYLMAAFNACMLVGYVAGASIKGIELESLEIETKGALDLRGFLGLDANVKPGYDEIRYTVRIGGNGTEEQFREIHETVIATSPNRWNIANPVRLAANLIIE